MLEKFGTNLHNFYTENVINYLQDLIHSPRKNNFIYYRFINSIFLSKKDC